MPPMQCIDASIPDRDLSSLGAFLPLALDPPRVTDVAFNLNDKAEVGPPRLDSRQHPSCGIGASLTHVKTVTWLQSERRSMPAVASCREIRSRATVHLMPTPYFCRRRSGQPPASQSSQ